MTATLFKIGILSIFVLNFNQAWSKNDVIENQTGAEQAFNYLNGIRQDLKLPVLRPNLQLQKAAANHAAYEVMNDQQGHEQMPNYAGFIGQWPTDRAYAVGYNSQASEVVSYNAQRPEKYIDDLMSAIYHRLGLLDMSKDEVGISIMEDHQGLVKSALVANLGNQNLNQACQRTYVFAPGTTLYGGLCKHNKRLAQTTVEQLLNQAAQSSPKLLFWPKSGATVPPVFYEENPDPLPNCNVSGYPIHLQINPNYWGKIHFKT
ncbi:MAG: CAP domain-containing protein, partial [Thiotrichales bacterium]|nr:CAP domain-containing protein [Thiotrichales bacterium]